MIKKVILLLAIIFCLEARTYKFTNELIYSHSPYLLQHAHNPVHWHNWNKHAFALAKQEHKLIFLSIGYSTCHWCHVMAKESFSNQKVANILNKYYISILVDKEQRPLIDKHFQNIYSMLHKNGGGWPLVVLLTSEAKPFYLTTYVPRQSKYGYLGLIEILNYFVKLKKNNNIRILGVAKHISNMLNTTKKTKFPKVIIGTNIIHNFIKGVQKRYDKDNPGIGISPKFPHANLINALLDIYKFNHNKKALFLATQMLSAMANGGIYDQLSGGFFRYAIDERWVIPHFEKMLYTNAQLLKDYIKAYKITKNILYLHVVNQTICFMQKRFEKDNLFFSAVDADSYDTKTKQLQEGAYYVYTYKEAKNILIDNNIKGYYNILAYLGIFKNGNFNKNKNNIYINPLVIKPKGVKKAKALLLQIRDKRKYPFIDTKILVAWNSMYIQSLFLDSSINPTIITLANKTLNSLIKKVYIDNQLYHEKILTVKPTMKANFADYSFLISTLLTAYSVTYNKAYLSLANKLTKIAKKRFYIDKQWYLSLKPFKIKATLYGGAYASALSVMLDNLIKLAILKENLSYENLVKRSFQQNSLLLEKYQFFVPTALTDYIKYKQGYIIIKARLKALLEIRKNLGYIYPYILYKVTQNNLYLACKIDKCFAYSHTEKGLIKKIKRYNFVR